MPRYVEPVAHEDRPKYVVGCSLFGVVFIGIGIVLVSMNLEATNDPEDSAGFFFLTMGTLNLIIGILFLIVWCRQERADDRQPLQSGGSRSIITGTIPRQPQTSNTVYGSQNPSQTQGPVRQTQTQPKQGPSIPQNPTAPPSYDDVFGKTDVP